MSTFNTSPRLTTLQANLTSLKSAIKTAPWIFATRNLFRGLYHRSASSVASLMLQRYGFVYLVDANYSSTPRVDLDVYRQIRSESIPLVRVNRTFAMSLPEDNGFSMVQFTEHGASLVRGDVKLSFTTASSIISAIAENGWHILTVDDARRILEGRNMMVSDTAYLTPKNNWLTDVEKTADAIGIDDSLYAFCEKVVAKRAATLVIYTPGLPSPMRLWRLNLKWLMPPVPPKG